MAYSQLCGRESNILGASEFELFRKQELASCASVSVHYEASDTIYIQISSQLVMTGKLNIYLYVGVLEYPLAVC